MCVVGWEFPGMSHSGLGGRDTGRVHGIGEWYVLGVNHSCREETKRVDDVEIWYLPGMSYCGWGKQERWE